MRNKRQIAYILAVCVHKYYCSHQECVVSSAGYKTNLYVCNSARDLYQLKIVHLLRQSCVVLGTYRSASLLQLR